MKKFLKYLGFGILSVVIFFVAIGIFLSAGSVDKKEVFVPFIKDSVPKLTTWKFEQYKLVMSEKGIEAATPEQWQLYLNKFEKLGTLQSVGEPVLENSKVASTIRTGTTTYAVYLVPLIFDTGEAHVRLGLNHNNGKAKIDSVRFLSDILLE